MDAIGPWTKPPSDLRIMTLRIGRPGTHNPRTILRGQAQAEPGWICTVSRTRGMGNGVGDADGDDGVGPGSVYFTVIQSPRMAGAFPQLRRLSSNKNIPFQSLGLFSLSIEHLPRPRCMPWISYTPWRRRLSNRRKPPARACSSARPASAPLPESIISPATFAVVSALRLSSSQDLGANQATQTYRNDPFSARHVTRRSGGRMSTLTLCSKFWLRPYNL